MLKNFRDKIDKIDAQILDLLKERVKYVKEIGHLKAQTGAKCFIKAEREANMISHLLSQNNSDLPQVAIIQIWRIIISLSLAIESNFKIALLGKQEIENYYITREYFGAFSHIDRTENYNINIIENYDVLILDPNSQYKWWLDDNIIKSDFKIFAKIPIFGKNNKFLFAAARIPIPQYNDDYSIIILKSDNSDIVQIKQSLDELSLEFSILSFSRKNNIYSFLLYIKTTHLLSHYNKINKLGSTKQLGSFIKRL